MRIVTGAIVHPSRYRVPEGSALVIFGASGNPTQRKLLPALYALTHGGMLPDHILCDGTRC
ncbi:MAG: hypothetical protein C3F12_03385 [Candidatus Methylomirabilota bacterium]|nr:hypothetical protein [Candidatus Methylomirabilis sp.]NJD68248.1 hypothetical protein [candidate division NC10 bacterium]PWB47741.1 MAG: hypothetical protein C3F12_03385 [candidate division NC10 bacterium]